MSHKRDTAGTVVGLLTFLVGVGLVGLTFKLAYDMFTTPVADALGVQEGQPLDLEGAGRSAIAILVRILLLLAMAAIGSVLANRGIRLYASAAPTNPPPPRADREPEAPAPSSDA